ncbi:MAG: hypothetical protein E3J72_02040 [Planctomycetota bacterium]|nr:MAG: hypothetical protein E3J72_02040 [Planctomycetota bacterium]
MLPIIGTFTTGGFAGLRDVHIAFILLIGLPICTIISALLGGFFSYHFISSKIEITLKRHALFVTVSAVLFLAAWELFGYIMGNLEVNVNFPAILFYSEIIALGIATVVYFLLSKNRPGKGPEKTVVYFHLSKNRPGKGTVKDVTEAWKFFFSIVTSVITFGPTFIYTIYLFTES